MRDKEINPDLKYPKGFKPELLQEWPADSTLVAPVDALPANLKASMGAHWELTQKKPEGIGGAKYGLSSGHCLKARYPKALNYSVK
ncbi:hypothetical protein [Microbulbifer pacificus]|uniref:hypothetical protein n=1 Tax=Microbulbifer pacificus TaxID=407164 RepID=UPI000CF50F99|nr:hypothetical protein [Microbulbifer pacificus]